MTEARTAIEYAVACADRAGFLAVDDFRRSLPYYSQAKLEALSSNYTEAIRFLERATEELKPEYLYLHKLYKTRLAEYESALEPQKR